MCTRQEDKLSGGSPFTENMTILVIYATICHFQAPMVHILGSSLVGSEMVQFIPIFSKSDTPTTNTWLRH